eukprot:CAMPEP_0172474974 /NCGR_PEP_ID=MMETSP1065-20121228/69632_1 /TAXON_ID=265537 /ORGANISM="Amphiprora paludosa, Strain CCMP125" /LENGTH=339 /DNA_ID=CAMNT_0013233167 /DNA_START=574 /DNA_END=1593 /DNA_ORIENTATION=-
MVRFLFGILVVLLSTANVYAQESSSVELVMFEMGSDIRVEWSGQLNDVSGLEQSVAPIELMLMGNKAFGSTTDWIFRSTTGELQSHAFRINNPNIVEFRFTSPTTNDGNWPAAADNDGLLADNAASSMGIKYLEQFNQAWLYLPFGYVVGSEIVGGFTIPNQSFASFQVQDQVTTILSWKATETDTAIHTVRFTTHQDLLAPSTTPSVTPTLTTSPTSAPSLRPTVSPAPSLHPTASPQEDVSDIFEENDVTTAPTLSPTELLGLPGTTPAPTPLPTPLPTPQPTLIQGNALNQQPQVPLVQREGPPVTSGATMTTIKASGLSVVVGGTMTMMMIMILG